jgi:hypothetical protein
MNGRCISQIELAQRWQISESTLERWRAEGIGPVFLKLRSQVRYRDTDILARRQQPCQGLPKHPQLPSGLAEAYPVQCCAVATFATHHRSRRNSCKPPPHPPSPPPCSTRPNWQAAGRTVCEAGQLMLLSCFHRKSREVSVADRSTP